MKWENGYCVKIEIMSFGVKENFVFIGFIYTDDLHSMKCTFLSS